MSMADKTVTDCGQSTVPQNLIISSSNANQSPENVVIQMKQDSGQKEGNIHQVSAFVKFIKSSLYSYKKKSDSNVVVNQRSINSLKNNSNGNVHACKNNLDISAPSFVPSINSSNDISCRFCQEFEPDNELVTPCLCSGTMKYIHQSCLQRWIKTQDNRFCELCKYEFHMKITTKPLNEWQSLEMSVMERRKVICSVIFHVIALTCVIWSLYVLIERTAEDMKRDRLEWPFWTKLIVISIGFIGGIVFMYVQGRMYVSLCRKWHAFNRTFIVQSISSTERTAAQRHVKAKSEDHQKKVRRPTNVGDISLERSVMQNTNHHISPTISKDVDHSSVSIFGSPANYIGYTNVLTVREGSVSSEFGQAKPQPTL